MSMNKGRFALIPLVAALGLVGCSGGGSSAGPIDDTNPVDSPGIANDETGAADTDTEVVVTPPRANVSLADTPANASMYLNSNNSALLNGPVIGGTGEPEELQFPRSLAMDMPISTDTFSIEGAFAVRDLTIFGDTSNNTNVVVVVRNVTDVVQCGFFSGLRFTLSDGTTHGGNDSFGAQIDGSLLLRGSVAEGNATISRTCLPPDGMVFTANVSPLAGFEEGIPIDQLAGMTGSRFSTLGVPYQIALEETILAPLSYTVTPENVIEVPVENRGNTAIDQLSLTLFALDPNGFPIGFGSNFLPEVGAIGPGETIVLTIDNDFMRASSSTLRVLVAGSLVDP